MNWQCSLLNISSFKLCVFVVEEDESALKRSELVNWYLKEIESEIDSEEELINKKRIIEKVVHRLTHYVCIHCLGSRVRGGPYISRLHCRLFDEFVYFESLGFYG